MGTKSLAIKFDRFNMASSKLRIGHTRTGACSSRGKCTCPARVRSHATHKKGK